MKQARAPRNRNVVNLAVDLAIFVAFLIAMEPHVSGVAVHEWLSIAFGAAIVTHLLLHWQWLVGVTKRFFGKVSRQARLNYVLNALLFIDMTVVIFTGLMVSEAALPLFGIRLPHDGFWMGLHHLSADLSVLLLGLHIALHWQWIVNATRRHLITSLLPRRRASQPSLSAARTGKEI